MNENLVRITLMREAMPRFSPAFIVVMLKLKGLELIGSVSPAQWAFVDAIHDARFYTDYRSRGHVRMRLQSLRLLVFDILFPWASGGENRYTLKFRGSEGGLYLLFRFFGSNF